MNVLVTEYLDNTEYSNSDMLIYNLKRYINIHPHSHIKFFFQTTVNQNRDTPFDIHLEQCINIVNPSLIIHTTTDSFTPPDIPLIYLDGSIKTNSPNHINIIHPTLYGPCDAFFTHTCNFITNSISQYYQQPSPHFIIPSNNTQQYMFVLDLVKIIYYFTTLFVNNTPRNLESVYHFSTPNLSPQSLINIIQGKRAPHHHHFCKGLQKFQSLFPTFDITNIDLGLLETKLYLDTTIMV